MAKILGMKFVLLINDSILILDNAKLKARIVSPKPRQYNIILMLMNIGSAVVTKSEIREIR